MRAYKKLAYESNRDIFLEKRRQYVARNYDAVRVSDRNSYLKNRKKRLAVKREYSKNNADLIAERERRYRERSRNAARERTARWYSENWERAKAYRLKNRERLRISSKEWAKKRAHLVCAIAARRRARKLRATPTWADHESIKAIYEKAASMRLIGQDVHVDHIVPLQGKTVCGLHWEENLQVIPSRVNIEKRNRWWPDMP